MQIKFNAMQFNVNQCNVIISPTISPISDCIDIPNIPNHKSVGMYLLVPIISPPFCGKELKKMYGPAVHVLTAGCRSRQIHGGVGKSWTSMDIYICLYIYNKDHI